MRKRKQYNVEVQNRFNLMDHFNFRDHVFDRSERTVPNPKRKSGIISDIHEAARGSKGIREDYYKVDESKILPHVRAGIKLDD